MIEIQKNQENQSPIEIHIQLNTKDLELEELAQTLSIEQLKEESSQLCKSCYDNNILNLNENLCQNCKEIFKHYRIDKSLFVFGGAVGAIIPAFIIGLNGLVCISSGLCLGVIVSNLYRFKSF
jgi:hypothetical protein